MTRHLALLIFAFATTNSLNAGAAAATTDHSHSSSSVQETTQAQDSANGSMTSTDLTGNVDSDTSALTTGTASGTTHGAIIDHTAKQERLRKKTVKSHKVNESTESGSTSSGDYGNENLYAPTTTQGRTPNDEIGLGVNGESNQLPKDIDEKSNSTGQSSSSGGGGSGGR